MPCSDDDYPVDDGSETINKLTRLLCMQCKFNEKHNYAKHPEVENWFRDHKIEDQSRKDQLTERQRQIQLEYQQYLDKKASGFYRGSSLVILEGQMKRLRDEAIRINEALTDDEI